MTTNSNHVPQASGDAKGIPQVNVVVECYSADRNARVTNFKQQSVDKTMFLEHGNMAFMPFVNNWPLIIASESKIDQGDVLVTLNIPAHVSYRIGNANGDVEATLSVEIDTLEWVLHVTEEDGVEWLHHEPATREYAGIKPTGVRDNEKGDMYIDISDEVKGSLDV